jgi:hypothetical protein
MYYIVLFVYMYYIVFFVTLVQLNWIDSLNWMRADAELGLRSATCCAAVWRGTADAAAADQK